MKGATGLEVTSESRRHAHALEQARKAVSDTMGIVGTTAKAVAVAGAVAGLGAVGGTVRGDMATGATLCVAAPAAAAVAVAHGMYTAR